MGHPNHTAIKSTYFGLDIIRVSAPNSKFILFILTHTCENSDVGLPKNWVSKYKYPKSICVIAQLIFYWHGFTKLFLEIIMLQTKMMYMYVLMSKALLMWSFLIQVSCRLLNSPIVGMVVTISPNFNLYRMVVFPAASNPTD